MSKIYVIGDNTTVVTPSDQSTGLLPRELHPEFSLYGSAPFAAAYDGPIIPMDQWPDRIADLERNKATLRHVWADSPIGVLNQSRLPYCHAFSPALAIMLMRHVQGLPYVQISAGSIGGPVTGYRARGAYVIDDLRVCVERGAASTEFVPIDRKSVV